MANKRIRMTVEFAVNDEVLKDTGVSFDDVINGIRFNEHDAVDGFEITTDISGCDCTSDFFLCGGDVVSIEKIEEPAKNRLDKINAFKGNSELLKAAAEQKVQDETTSLVAQIRALNPRIDELIATGNACLENGIELNVYGKGMFNCSDDSYERGTFVTNSISHRVGFVKSAHDFTELGINNGGACGHYDFRTDGERVYFVNEDNKTDIKDASHRIKDLKKFLENFDGFESAFYTYVDMVIEKQQKSVDAIIAEASGRVKDGLSDSGEKDLEM